MSSKNFDVAQGLGLLVAFRHDSDMMYIFKDTNPLREHMINLSSHYIASTTYVLNFKKTERQIRLQQAQAEEAFGGMITAQSQQTNLPDQVDPKQPRIIFQKPNNSIAISQNSCQWQVVFDNENASIDRELQKIEDEIQEFYKRAIIFRPKKDFGSAGLVFEINFPSNSSALDLQKYLHNTFIKTKPIGEVASIQINMGFELNGYFLTISAAAYESRRIEIKKDDFTTREDIDMKNYPVTETGINLKLDINSLPKTKKDPTFEPENPTDLIEITKKFLGEQLENILGLKIN